MLVAIPTGIVTPRPRSTTMRTLHALLTLPLVVTPLAWATAQDDIQPERSAEAVETQDEAQTEIQEAKSPMEVWSRMAGGEWRVTYPGGQELVQTWNWGPGKHSMRILSYRPDSLFEPPNGVHLLYWHPGRKEFVLKGLLSKQRYMDGVMKIDGDNAELTFDFHTGSATYQMSQHWTFDGAAKFHETMYSHTDTGVSPIRESDYIRSKDLTPIKPRTADNAPKPSEALASLSTLVGHTWEAKGKWATGKDFTVESEFTWVPESDAIYARAFAPATKDAERTLLLDAYFYTHPKDKTLHYLALAKWGDVSEGNLRALPSGGVELTLKSYDGDKVSEYMERLDFEEDGRLRDRVWSMTDGKLGAMLDIHHNKIKKAEVKKD
jgi:hypothetical protein